MDEIPMIRGDSYDLTIRVTDGGGAAVDLSDSVLTWTAKRRTADPDNEAVFGKSLDEGITLGDPEDGIIPTARIRIDPGDWPDEAITLLYWDLQEELADDVTTLARGTIRVEDDVTKGSAGGS